MNGSSSLPESNESRLTVFLVVLSLYLFVLLPVTESATWQGHAVNAGFIFVVASGVFAGASLRRARIAAAGLGVIGILGAWALGRGEDPKILAWGLSCTLLFLLLTTGSLIRQVFAPGRVSAHRLRGAVAVFLLIGLVWAVAYGLTEALVPGNSLQPSGVAEAGESNQRFPDQIYFSFVTLTTVGYGDVAPVGAVMRALAVVEALTGQLYLAILVARLVSLELLERQK